MTTSESECLQTIQSELKLASLGRRKELVVKLSPDLHICTVSSTLTHSTHTSTNNNKEKFFKNKKKYKTDSSEYQKGKDRIQTMGNREFDKSVSTSPSAVVMCSMLCIF